MSRIVLLLCFFMPLVGQSQTYRTYTGWGNNVDNPAWGAGFSQMQTRTTVAFGNGFSTPAGASRANARLISNYLMSQPNVLPSSEGLSDYVWAFGQFIDHDITLVHNNNEFIPDHHRIS
ncbi:MAG: peroxidase family protein [Saprospiraceae bacterium]